MGARAWPSGGLCPGPEGLGCGTRFAQTVLAPISDSRPGRSHARRRHEVARWDRAGMTSPSCVAAPSHGAFRWLYQRRVRRQKKEKAKTKDNYQLQRRWILDY